MTLLDLSLNFDSKQIFICTMTLFYVIDIFGNLPIIIQLRQKTGHIESEKATIVAGILFIIFLFLGKEFLDLIGLNEQSFAVAGSFILFFLALEMILGVTIYKEEDMQSASLVPIAFPLIAGSASLTTLLSLRADYAVENIVVAIMINLVLVYVSLKFSSTIERFLGPQGVSVMRKVFGVILLAIAVKIFVENIKQMFV